MNGIQRMNPDDDVCISGKDLKALVAFGRRCARTAFPNPTRTGCPDRSRLRAMAYRDPKLTFADLPIEHVVRCSPCFQEYIQFRRMAIFARGLKITAASVIVATVLVTAALLLRNLASNRAERSISQQRQVQPDSSSRQSSPPPTSRIPPVQMKIDLAAFSPTRGDDERPLPKPIHLPQRNLRIALQMPLGFDAGEYLIQLKDSKGTLYFDKRAQGYVAGGTTSVEIGCDLTAKPPGKATLLIRPPGLSWRSFPVVIK